MPSSVVLLDNQLHSFFNYNIVNGPSTWNSMPAECKPVCIMMDRLLFYWSFVALVVYLENCHYNFFRASWNASTASDEKVVHLSVSLLATGFRLSILPSHSSVLSR